MTSRRATALKVTGVIFGVILLVSVSLAALFHFHVERRWTAMERRCAELRAELSRTRPSLRGQATPGDAREDYLAAVAAAEPFAFATYNTDTIIPSLAQDPPLSDADLQKLLKPVIVPLKRGAARERFERKLGLDLRPGEEEIDYNYAVVRIAAFQARYLRRQGHRREAAELLLDACRFGTDIGLPYLLMPPLSGLSDLLQETALARADAAEIARELEILEAELPARATEARWELLHMGTAFLQTEPARQVELRGWGVPETPIDWHFGWSLRFFLADGFLGADRICRDLDRRDGWPWPEARREWDAPRPASTERDNPIPSHFESMEVPFDMSFRESLAKLRILRVAVRYRATGEILALQDPFGTSIQTRKTSSALRIWSAGDRTPIQLYRFQGKEIRDLRFHPLEDNTRDPEIFLEVPP